MSISKLKVISEQANTQTFVTRKAPDSVLIEDIYRSLAQEFIPENELDICKLSPAHINPIQRECMFRMPGRPKREAMSNFAKFKMQSQCLCRKYGYERARETILRHIDNEFNQLEERFQYKMTKSLQKQIDIDLFSDEVKSHFKSKLQDQSQKFQKEIDELIKQVSHDFFEKSVCPTYLDVQSVQKDINNIIHHIQSIEPDLDQQVQLSTIFIGDYKMIIQKMRFCAASPTFVKSFFNLAEQLERHVKTLNQQLEDQENLIRGRMVQFKELKPDVDLLIKLQQM
ncbi:Conserved_hypothetical protein [Hexamita inflata]|uniref:Uncharacterized protein n=1 Tax=Hexamita inflata TaxID=28002 RepID=A0AA86REY9_9EUKA|nr:Conserved hypothetical protein [Hexamita inflata]